MMMRSRCFHVLHRIHIAAAQREQGKIARTSRELLSKLRRKLWRLHRQNKSSEGFPEQYILQ